MIEWIHLHERLVGIGLGVAVVCIILLGVMAFLTVTSDID